LSVVRELFQRTVIPEQMDGCSKPTEEYFSRTQLLGQLFHARKHIKLNASQKKGDVTLIYFIKIETAAED
jgi:hypothetical protein